MKRLSLFLLVLLCFGCSESEVDTFGGIAGTVADEITKEPLAGVKVSLTPGGTSQVTGTEGNFLFDNIDPQEYTLTFTKDDYVSQTQKVSVKAGTASNVQISMEPITPILNVMPKELDFGEETATLAIDITNAGKGTLQWNIDEDIAWLSCSPVSGTTNKESSPVVVTVSRTEMDRGDYNGMIVVTSNGGSQKIPVSMSVESVNLEIEPEELNFGSLTNSIQLTLKNTGSGTLKYTVESSNEWLVLNKESGSVTKTDYLEAIVTREGLSAGKYNATISFSVSGGNVVVPVKMEVAVNEKPTVSVENATDATYNSAVLHGTMVSVGSSKVTKYGFCWSEQPTPTLEDSYSNLGDCTAPTAFESVANDLKSDTKYYFRAYAENNVGIVYSEKELTFTTAGLPTLPSVTSGAVTEITSTTAVAKGNITSLGNVGKVTAYGHVWSKTAEPTLQTGKYTNLGEATETMAFSSEITGLESHTIYYIRAYATNEKGTAYGEENVFTTAKNDVRLTTSDVTEIVHNAATCGGVIADNGGHTIKERGVCWSTKSAPTVEDNYTVADNDKLSALVSRSIPSSVKTRTEYVTRAEDRFSCRITELAKETNYHVRAYVRTSDGNVFYGNEKQFTTTEEVALPSLTEITVSNIQTTSATVVSKIESDGNSAISECGFCYSKGAAPTVESGAKIACDPSSAELGKNITGLEEGTTYHIRAYAKNAMGVAYSKEAEFTTLAVTVPKLSPVVIENVGRTTAYASATVAETGNASITECGFCWATNPDPTIYDNKVPCEVGNSFKTKLQDLPLLTTVYVRAYAINSKGTGYSDDASFTTTDTDIDIWDGVSVATKFGGGMGTESDPIIINSADQLRLLLDRVSSGTTYSGVVFKMTTNIGLNNHAWSRSGTFAGTFDGNNMLLTGCRGDCREQIKTFYTAYLENILHDNSRNEELCRSYLTEELLEKVDRLINATNVDPLIRAQDASLDAIETLNIEPLIKNWYMVRYYWDKKDSTTIKEIPIKAQSINGKCLITYITPIWSGSHYGDDLISCKSKNSLHINQETAQAFLESFYKLYIAEYSEMSKDLSSKLALLRNRHLSENALVQYKNAEFENSMDGYRGYDLLIDNYDFDRVWSESLKFKQLNDNDCLVSYKVNGKIYKIVISIKKNGNEYIVNEIKVIK